MTLWFTNSCLKTKKTSESNYLGVHTYIIQLHLLHKHIKFYNYQQSFFLSTKEYIFIFSKTNGMLDINKKNKFLFFLDVTISYKI